MGIFDAFSSSLGETNDWDVTSNYAEMIHAELPEADLYSTAQTVLAQGDNNTGGGFGGLDQMLRAGKATADSLLGVWGNVQQLQYQRDAMAVASAKAQSELEVARAQIDANKQVELAKAKAQVALAVGAQDAARGVAAVDWKSALGVAALIFVGAKLLKGKK